MQRSYKAERQRFISADNFAGPCEFLHFVDRYQVAHCRRDGHIGNQAPLDLHDRQLCVWPRDTQVCTERDLQAGAERDPVYRADNRHWQLAPDIRSRLESIGGRAADRLERRCTEVERRILEHRMSIPAQKLSPAPVRTTARMERSCATLLPASRNASNIARLTALALSGRFKVTVATWSLTSTNTGSVICSP